MAKLGGILTFLALPARSSAGSDSTPSLICWKSSDDLNPATLTDIFVDLELNLQQKKNGKVEVFEEFPFWEDFPFWD